MNKETNPKNPENRRRSTPESENPTKFKEIWGWI